MKSNVTLRDKLAKQNEISRQRLAQELVKLEKVEQSDLRMIETARHRFRSCHKNLETRRSSTGSNAVNVRMYETHNPGFCYHCTGAIKEAGPTIEEETPKDSYEFVRSILFTNDEIDPRKVLCLHLLTAHSTKLGNNDTSTVKPVASLSEKAKKKRFSGAWNNILPCYVVDTEEASSDAGAENVKLHENPSKVNSEDQTIRDFQQTYDRYMDENVDFGKALSSNAKHTGIALHGLEKMPPISPHVYSLLGPSHELRIKQALAEGVTRKEFARSSMELNELDERSLSFRFDDHDDPSSRTTNASNRNWVTRSPRIQSRRSTIGSLFKLDHGITMLKRTKPNDNLPSKLKTSDTPKDLIAIKSSFKGMKEAPSKTSTTKSPFHGIFETRSSSNSILSASLYPELTTKKYRQRIYLNTPITSVELQNKDRKIVPILVNYQVQALIQTVLEVLERVNPEKSKNVIETAKDIEKMKKMLLRPDIQNFAQSLLGQTLLSSPESFVISDATMIDEIDFKLEKILEKEIIALTLEMPLAPFLDALIAEIRSNIFIDTKKRTRLNEYSKNLPSISEEKKIGKENHVNSNSNEMHANDELKIYLKRDEKFPRGNKGICCRTKKYKKIMKPKKRVNNDKQSSMNENDSRNKGVNQTTKKSNENRVMQASEISGLILKKNSKIKAIEQQDVSGNGLAKRTSNSKAWKAAQDLGHLDADHVILRRMTNTQRILVGQMCASLKTKKINNQGLINERVPLAALITPALSRTSIKFLTRGTVYSKTRTVNNKQQEEIEDNTTVPDKLTGPLLAKIRQDIAENETKKRLKCFLKN